MTKISEIHGIGRDEFAQRGQEVTSGGYLPYLSLTSGEMRLMLAQQRAKIYAQFYPDVPQYRAAVTMIDNALHAGVSRGVHFVGAIHDNYLQQIARIIQSASRQTSPASRSGFFARPGGVVSGIGEIIPSKQRRDACMTAVIKKGGGAGAIKKGTEACDRQFNIEEIFNAAIEKCGHHVIYHKIPDSATIPSRVDIKRILHLGGVEGMAGAGNIQSSLMSEWVENGIIAKNAFIGVGPLHSIAAAVQLSPDPDKFYKQFTGQSGGASTDKWRPGAVNSAQIGVIPAVAIAGAIATALIAAKDLVNALFKQNAIIKAESFGTSAYSAGEFDFEEAGTDQNPEVSPGTNTLLLLLAAAGVALYALSD